MKSKKRRLCFTLIVLISMMLALTAANAAGGGDGAAEEMVEITWLIKSTERSWCHEHLEEALNVKIMPNGIYTNDSEKVTVMLAAGEFPDCGYLGRDPKEMLREGVIRGIPKEMILSYAPGYARILDEIPYGWLMNRNPDNQDEYLALAGLSMTTDTAITYWGFRTDWAENVGFELPDYDKNKVALDSAGRCYFLNDNKTLDWAEKLLIAFRDGDPDGNGKVDTIPWAGCNNKYHTWSPILGAFGVTDSYNLLEEGELVQWNIAKGYREFLRLATRWYQLGLLDKEFPIIDMPKLYEKFGLGIVASGKLDVSGAGLAHAVNRHPNNLVKEEELGTGAEVVILPPPIGPTGLQGAKRYRAVGALGYDRFMVNAKVTDEKLAKILQVLDYIRFSDEEAWVYAFSGKPGVHFDWEGEEWASAQIIRKAEDVPEGYPKIGGFNDPYPPNYAMNRLKFRLPTHMVSFFESWLLAEPGQRLCIAPYRVDLLGETNLGEIASKYGGTLTTIIDEFYYGVITGDIDLDAEWDAYVAMWRKNGGDEQLAELAKAPLLSGLREGKLIY